MGEPACQPVLPLDMLLALMNEARAEDDRKMAADLAKAAAPYLHAKATTRPRAEVDDLLSDDELHKYIRALLATDDDLPR